MNFKTVIVTISILGIILFTASCEKEGNEGNETKISYHFEDESHNHGQNCMNCHVSGGNGEGWFTAAGSVYNSTKTSAYANATVRLYTGPNATGTLVKTIEVDGKGNLFTTENIDFSNGLYATITGTTGQVETMNSIFNNGNCNSCHGVSTEKLWIK